MNLVAIPLIGGVIKKQNIPSLQNLLQMKYGVSGVPRRLTKFSGNNSRFISSKNN
ncbi:18326_t:CDS:2 [Entrophospora sp. SA101]|nr:18326_t:CDS:2 [Entrophospora sp. SA101]